MDIWHLIQVASQGLRQVGVTRLGLFHCNHGSPGLRLAEVVISNFQKVKSACALTVKEIDLVGSTKSACMVL